jgi:hypothetical protein
MKKSLSLVLAFIAIASFANAQNPQRFYPKKYERHGGTVTHPSFLTISLRTLLLQPIKTNCL